MPDKSGNNKSSLAIVIISSLVNTRGLDRESKLANESLSLVEEIFISLTTSEPFALIDLFAAKVVALKY